MFEDQMKDDEPKKKSSRFLPGNKFWMNRRKHGRNRLFEDPDDLDAACHEYFEWADQNPLYELKVFANGTIFNMPKRRVMSIEGLCNYVGIARRTWDHYRDRDDFKDVCYDAENIMRQQKYEGACAGQFNANIIARDLGLSEKIEANTQVTVEVIDTYEGDEKDPNS